MRRYLAVFTLLLALCAAALPGLAQSEPAIALQITLPGTNTPNPRLIEFETNTPEASPTPRATFTPSATFTASPTATFTATPTPIPTNTPSPTPTPIGPYSYPEGISPLTGLPYPDEAAINRRNLIVKVSNFPPVVRPQTGLNLADVVYEYEVEGGVTRFAAIFRSNAPDHVGSVRSARLFDMELIQMYNALLAYSGTSEPIQKLILSAPFVFQTFSPLKGDGCEDAGFCRFPQDGKAFEHTLFLDTNKIWEKATRRGVNEGLRARGFAFNEKADPGGTPGLDVYIDWYGQTDARWQFDRSSQRYLRYTDSVPHFDAGDGQQLWTDNIVIIEVPHNERPDLFPPDANYKSHEIALRDQGRAFLVRDGQYYQGFWFRRSENPGDALILIYGNNVPMMMKPGRTYVEVVRWLGDVRISATQPDMAATATVIQLSATPTFTVTPGPSPTPAPDI